jgi:hypothetical protein
MNTMQFLQQIEGLMVAYADEGVVVVYNNSCTFNVWMQTGNGFLWNNTDCFTREVFSKDAETIKEIALNWLFQD